MKKYKIFVINPGSTSTKLALFENEHKILETNVFHDSSVLLQFPTVNAQLPYRKKLIMDFLSENHIDLSDVDAIVGRGGSCYPVASGVYVIDDKLIEDTAAGKGGMEHPSNLGVQLARKLQKEFGGRIFMVDPPCVDELCDMARMTRHRRRAAPHQYARAQPSRRCDAPRKACSRKKYEDCCFIVCHIDGGISVSAHRYGRIIDCNDAAGGDGPYTPTRIGSVSVADILEYVRDKDIDEVKKLCTRTGGFVSHFGTSSSDAVHKMAEEGNKKAIRVWDGMKYQIVKYIGAMAAVLGGRVDGILLTGGLLRFEDITQTIREQCEWIAPGEHLSRRGRARSARRRSAARPARRGRAQALHRASRLGRLARRGLTGKPKSRSG